jgi:thiamine-phosphate pyrophosphorylase
LARTRLYLIATPDGAGRWPQALHRALSTGLVGMVQLRDKDPQEAAVVQRAAIVAALARDAGVLWILNDRPDLAARLGADGVHVGEDDPCAADARRAVGPDRLVGISTHDPVEVGRAVEGGADYAGIGPCFATHTKELRRRPGGADLVREAAAVARLPLFAIGGVAPGNAASLVAAGARRLAVGSAILSANDPAAAARALADQLPPA